MQDFCTPVGLESVAHDAALMKAQWTTNVPAGDDTFESWTRSDATWKNSFWHSRANVKEWLKETNYLGINLNGEYDAAAKEAKWSIILKVYKTEGRYPAIAWLSDYACFSTTRPDCRYARYDIYC